MLHSPHRWKRDRGPGQLASGWIEVPDGVDPGTRIPVTVANGAAAGPVLALVAGTHGSEYTSILALQRLRRELEPARMRGRRHPGPHGEPSGFYGRRIYYSPDGKNLNRVYPGQADGTVSDRMAHAITREVIDRCTHLADMHCGDGNESLRPYTYWIIGGDAAVDAADPRAGPRLRSRPHPDRPRAPARSGREPVHRQHGDHPRQARDHRRVGGHGPHRRAFGGGARGRRALAARASRHPGRAVGARDAPGLDRPRGGPARARHRRLASDRREDAVGLDGRAPREAHRSLRRRPPRGATPPSRASSSTSCHAARDRRGAACARSAASLRLPGSRRMTGMSRSQPIPRRRLAFLLLVHPLSGGLRGSGHGRVRPPASGHDRRGHSRAGRQCLRRGDRRRGGGRGAAPDDVRPRGRRLRRRSTTPADARSSA